MLMHNVVLVFVEISSIIIELMQVVSQEFRNFIN